MPPFFSIIVPCCNVGQYAAECLRSIRNQSFQDWECLAVVETSMDNTERIVREFADKDKRIRFFIQPRSGSPAAPRNTGLEHAQGKYVVFVDGDDYIFENALERLAEKISTHPDADLYPGDLLAQNTKTGKDEVRDNFRADDPTEMTGPEAILLYRDRVQPCPMAQMTICRREFLIENDLRFVPGLKYEDGEFSPRALYRAEKVVPVHTLFYFYRMTPNSITTRKDKTGVLLRHHAWKMRRLFEFHTNVSKEKGYDFRISEVWAKWIIDEICWRWFSPWSIRSIPRRRRGCTLHLFLADSDDFSKLMRHSSFLKRTKAFFVLFAARHPTYGIIVSDLFFLCFFRLTKITDVAKTSLPFH